MDRAVVRRDAKLVLSQTTAHWLPSEREVTVSSNPQPERRQVIISTDGHAGADLWDYKPYLESRYHEQFDAWASTFHDAWPEDTDQARPLNHRLGVASATAPLNWDPRCVSSTSTVRASPPKCSSRIPHRRSTRRAPSHRRARVETRSSNCDSTGLRAHNRWIADFCSEAPDRWAGFAQVFLDDIDAAVTEVRWAKDAGPPRRSPPERPRAEDGEPVLPAPRPAVGGVCGGGTARASTRELPDRVGPRRWGTRRH